MIDIQYKNSITVHERYMKGTITVHERYYKGVSS